MTIKGNGKVGKAIVGSRCGESEETQASQEEDYQARTKAGEGPLQMKRVHVYISGRVQGVFFRHHTMREATRLGVCGWVQNLPDGRVEAIFEGKEPDVNRMLGFCKTGPPGAGVENVEITEEPFLGEFAEFIIRL
ncbi:MAG: acylphosphatase [archaeon]